MTARIFTSFLVLMYAASAQAQVKTFRWNDELCEYSGTYNARKHTAARLQNTLRLMMPGEFSLNADATVWNYEDIAKLDPDALEREYNSVTAKLKALDIVAAPYWEEVRRKKIAEIEQVYRLARVTMRAYTKPAILREYNGADSCKIQFAEPLIAGGDLLLGAWRSVNEDSRRKNSDPERLRRIFDQQFRSRDKFKFAQVEVMSFGWWNCANETIEYETPPEGTDHQREFKKLFTRVRTVRCDEP